MNVPSSVRVKGEGAAKCQGKGGRSLYLKLSSLTEVKASSKSFKKYPVLHFRIDLDIKSVSKMKVPPWQNPKWPSHTPDGH